MTSPDRPHSDPASPDVGHFRAMVQHGWDVIKLLAADGAIRFVSAAVQPALGFSPASLIGRHAQEFLHPDDAASVLEHFATLIERPPSDQPLILTYRCRKADGSYCWMEGIFTNLLDEPDVRAVVLNERDVTDRKLAQADRDQLLIREQAARADAEAAIRARDSFLSTVSHELRTPLTPVLLCVSDLQRDADLSAASAAEELAMIREQIELEIQLIDDLLDLTRLSQGKITLNLQSIDTHVLLRDALQAASRDIREKNLTVTLELAATSSRVSADPRRLKQVLWNILSNAAKFTSQNGRILVRTEDGPDSRLLVHVIDTGIGFTPDIAALLFRPFEQAEKSLTRRFGGLGLGLTIARSLAELHNGAIRASSPGPLRGATFTLDLPAAQSLPAAAANGPSASPPASPPLTSSSLNILLVEDNANTLNLMSRLLQHSGHRVTTASTLDGALRVIEDRPVDLLISDLGLPDGSGWELLRRAAAIRHFPAIALSGFSADEDVERSRRAGFAVHLIKPVTPQKLQEAIRKATQSAPALPQPAPRPQSGPNPA